MPAKRIPVAPRRGPGRPAGSRPREGRDTLLVAARELLAERGLPGITLRAVAERAGVQPALASYYFGNKEGLLRAVIYLVAGEAHERMRPMLEQGGSVEERLRALIENWVSTIAADPYLPRLIVEQVLFGEAKVIDEWVTQFAKPTAQSIRSLLAEGRKTGVLRDVEPMFLIPSMAGMCAFFFLAAPILKRLFGLRRITRTHIQRFAEHAGELILHGTAAQGASR